MPRLPTRRRNVKRRPRRSKTCRGLGRAAQQISCQSCADVLYLFSRRRPGGDRRADRRCLNRGVSVAGIAAREGRRQKRSRPEMAPQQVEKIGFAPGNAMVPESREVTRCSKGARGWPCATPQERQSCKRDKGTKGQKKAPNALKSLDAKLKSAPVAAGDAGRARWRGIVREATAAAASSNSRRSCKNLEHMK